jgi:hypothetical protein
MLHGSPIPSPLIPDHPEFVPKSAGVAAFLDDLVSLHGAFLEATIWVGKLSGEFLTRTDKERSSTELRFRSFPARL